MGEWAGHHTITPVLQHSSPPFTFITESADETIEAGRALARFLDEGDMVGLVGELGSGKTWFTKGIALGLGVPSEVVVTSPSFALVHEYAARVVLYHMDVYRLETPAEFVSAGLEEYLCGKAVTVMEWADRWPDLLPGQRVTVVFTIMDDHCRKIALTGAHPRAVEIIESFMKEVGKE
ncbi:MAG: tRNA (adenosine(37)-N6)-threonylcarbamoyltransferase complex ATPase subunit type 1 TsaE [Deltaproteobacteria bacterium]|nr:tRNA (adenosine(37)-N6)-threonylcarbamoyltransferase complex ATPase subunit type 1 TsaE [Deltaproteobacteria bacterium]